MPTVAESSSSMGAIYERRHQHHPLHGAWAGYMPSPLSVPPGVHEAAAAAVRAMDLTDPKFEPPSQPLEQQQEEREEEEDHHALALALPESPDSSDHDPARPRDKIRKTRRLAQNREAARKSRLRKKAYIQNLETSRMKLARMEQELAMARQQHVPCFGRAGTSTSSPVVGRLPLRASFNPGVAAFEIEYARWVEEQGRQTAELRAALQLLQPDPPRLRLLAEAALAHYDRLFEAKSAAARRDVFFVMSGAWRSPAERFFLWISGFRPSDLLAVLSPHLQTELHDADHSPPLAPALTEAQAEEVARLRQTSRQAEDALYHGLDTLQQALAESLLAPAMAATAETQQEVSFDSGYGGGDGGEMGGAMGRLEELAGFVEQADHLRQQTLRNMYRILTPTQAARGLLALGEYFHRLRSLSELWVKRPREPV